MVSLITNGHSTDWRGRPFRRRRLVPGMIVAAVLVLVVIVTWSIALTSDADTAAAAACNTPEQSDGTDSDLGKRADGSIRSTDPAPLWNTHVRVFNANGQGGQAAHVAAQLSDKGFHAADDNAVANDPVYTRQNLQCQGQIRFGDAGEAAASSLWLMMPCAELIHDDRSDDTVDLALGTLFNDLSPNADAEALLKSLRVADGAPAPEVDSALVSGAHDVRC